MTIHLKSKVTVINKENPTIDYFEFNPISRKETKKTIPRFYCRVGDEIIGIGKSVYVYKDGFFYICKNNKGEVFFLDSKQVENKKFNLLD